MSPKTRRRPTGRVERTVRQAGRELGAAARSAPAATARAVGNRTTKVQCPWCPTRPWIGRGRWEEHARAHRTADGRKTLAQQRIEEQRRQAARRADNEAERARRPVNHQARAGHGPVTPWTRPQDRAPSPHIHYVDDDGNRIDWEPGQPLPPNTSGHDVDPELARRNPDHDRTTVLQAMAAVVAAVALGAWRWFTALFGDRAEPEKWGGPDTADPAPQPEPVAPSPEPESDEGQTAPVVPIRGGTVPRTRGTTKKTTTTSAGSPASAAGASGMGDAAMQWARALPESLVLARFDAQAISEALAEVANALRMRANLETDRSISPHCVEPYEEAAAKLLAAADDCQEVHGRLVARYGATAEELAKPDTPDPEYLKEGV